MVNMTDKHREVFRDFAEEVVDKFPEVERIVLFGSVARGSHGVDSDVDVLVVTEKKGYEKEIESLALEKTSEHGVSVTPIVTTGGRQSSLMETIEQEGVEYVRG